VNLKSKLMALTAVAGTTGAVLLTAACGQPGAVSYYPMSFGVPGHCYYVSTPAEVIALRGAGLCPASWLPTPMPLSWEEEYYSYYDSSAYYDTYVPAASRTVFVTRMMSFGGGHRSQISTLSRSATYRSSSGSTVKGTQIAGKSRFGSGCSFSCAGSKYGGGSLRTGTSRTSTRSFGGGGLRGRH
jgi:hypothetical protein